MNLSSDVRPSPVMTHRGWIWFAPIYAGRLDEPTGPMIEARHRWLEPLLTGAYHLEYARIWLTSIIDPYYDPDFMMLITGKIQD